MPEFFRQASDISVSQSTINSAQRDVIIYNYSGDATMLHVESTQERRTISDEVSSANTISLLEIHLLNPESNFACRSKPPKKRG
jgi:hypothetical protein